MKGKKLLSIMLVLCLTVAFAVSNVTTAYADNVYYVGTAYNVEYILEAAGFEKLIGQDTYLGGRTVEYQQTADAEGVAIENAPITPVDADFVFESAGKYTFRVYVADTGAEENNFTVTVVEDEGNYENFTRISGVSYSLNDVLTSFGLDKLENKNYVTDGRTVKYRLARRSDNTVVTEDDEEAEAAFTTLESTVEFKNIGVYKFEVYKGEDDNMTLEGIFNVTVTKNVTPADPDYNKTSVTYQGEFYDYIDEIATASENLITGDSFTVPSLEGYVSSPDFAYSTLQKKVYYCAPDSSSYTQGSTVTTSDASFEVNKLGTYTYYVLFADVFGNEMTTDTLVLGEGGWYKTEDNEGKTPVGEVVIPVFSFTVATVKAPEISVKASDNAYLGLNYEVKAFNIVSDNYNTVYKLYYSETNYDKDSDAYATDADYIQAVLAGSEDITDELNTGSLTFTPDKKGYYYVQVQVIDEYNNEDVAMSRAIACLGEAKSVNVEKEFFKYNVTSIVFLSIAGACFIAIIVLLLIKPKETATVEVEGDDTAK